MEATKFTETGFHGRDVDQIIRDLVENALALTKQKLRERNKQQIENMVEEYILKELCGLEANKRTKVRVIILQASKLSSVTSNLVKRIA